MFDTSKVVINGAFYEMYESCFGDDFFVILASMRQTPRIQAMRKRTDLSESEKEEVLQANVKLGAIMKKQTPRIAYIGHKLYLKQFEVSYNDYLSFLTETDASDFLDAEVIKKIWEKIHLDQKTPRSAKNA